MSINASDVYLNSIWFANLLGVKLLVRRDAGGDTLLDEVTTLIASQVGDISPLSASSFLNAISNEFGNIYNNGGPGIDSKLLKPEPVTNAPASNVTATVNKLPADRVRVDPETPVSNETQTQQLSEDTFTQAQRKTLYDDILTLVQQSSLWVELTKFSQWLRYASSEIAVWLMDSYLIQHYHFSRSRVDQPFTIIVGEIEELFSSRQQYCRNFNHLYFNSRRREYWLYPKGGKSDLFSKFSFNQIITGLSHHEEFQQVNVLARKGETPLVVVSEKTAKHHKRE